MNCFTKFLLLFYSDFIFYIIFIPPIYYIFSIAFIFFLPPMYSIFVVVCCKVWTLGVWGELACHKRLFNPPPQFSRLGTWCPTFLCASVCLVCVFGWRDGGWRVTSFFFFFFFCYLFYLASMLYTYFSCMYMSVQVHMHVSSSTVVIHVSSSEGVCPSNVILD